MRSDRDRDAEVDRLLRAGLPGEPAAPAGACPSADDLAAYVECSLPRGDRAAMEGHLAACASCQEALALLAAMDEGNAPSPAASPAASWWRAGWKRWLVPLGAVATGVLLYVAVQPDARVNAPVAARDSIVASVPERQPAAPAARVDEHLAPPPAAQPPEAPLKDQARLVAPVPRQERQDLPVPREKAGGAKSGLSPLTVIPPADPMMQDPAPVPTLVGARTPAAPPPPPPPTLGAAKGEPARTEAKGQAVQALPVVGGIEARDVSGREAAEPQATRELRAEGIAATRESPPAKAITNVAPITVVAAGNRDVRWHLGGGGGAGIARSTDGGRTWQLQHSAPGRLYAASAPSATTCWAAGAAGLVLLTTDGATWTVRPFPETVDLSAVTATDARKATVTAKDGRRFSTEDGGAHWAQVR